MHGKVLSKLTRGRFVMDRPVREDHVRPEARLAEHRDSILHRGPDPHTTRLQLRSKLGDERELVRGLYDRTAKPRRRRRKR